jgi:amino acid transporter
MTSVLMAAALIFVAYEGFQLITNAVCETDNPHRNIPRAIYGSVTIVVLIYVTLSIVAIGSISVEKLVAAKEYALAVAVGPFLGSSGRTLVSLAALLATSSAINATMFGASGMMAELASDDAAPVAFPIRNRVDVPWIAMLNITILAIGLTALRGLQLIAAFSSMTFLIVSLAVSIANFRLRNQTGSRPVIVLTGMALILATIVIMCVYRWRHSPANLAWISSIYGSIIFLVFALQYLRSRHV